MADNEDRYKLHTRRVLAWATVIPVVLSLCFIAVYATIYKNTELVTLALGILSGSVLGSVLTLYFGRRLTEE